MVTVNAPPGLKNGTEQRVTIIGMWSYIPESQPGLPTPEPIKGEISPVNLNVVAINESSDGPDNNGNGKDDKKDKDDGFLPGFESVMVLTSTLIVIIVLFHLGNKRRKL